MGKLRIVPPALKEPETTNISNEDNVVSVAQHKIKAKMPIADELIVIKRGT